MNKQDNLIMSYKKSLLLQYRPNSKHN